MEKERRKIELCAGMCVFWNGKYSKARTLAIENNKAVLMLDKPLN